MPASSHSTEIGSVVADGVEHPEARPPTARRRGRWRRSPSRGAGRPRAGASRAGRCGRCRPALRVLAVDVVDPVLEVPEEADRVEVLPHEVARVPVQAERRRGGRSPRARARSSSSRRRSRSGAPRGRTARPPRRRRRGSGSSGRRSPGSRRRSSPAATGGNIATVLPDRRAGEADDGVDAELARRPARWSSSPRRPAAGRPRGRRRPRSGPAGCPVPLVDRVVADGLADEVVGDRPAPSGRACSSRSQLGPRRSRRPRAALSTSRWSPQQAISRPS